MKKKDQQILGLGTAAIGRPQYINIRQEASKELSLEAFRLNGLNMLDAAYDQGIRYFDTAPGYGLAEQLLIDWLQGKHDPAIELATKWGYTYVANFDPHAPQHEIKEHSLNKLNEQWEQSKSLFPFFRTYQIHSATFETGVLENEAVLNRLAELKQEHNLLIGITTSGSNQVQVINHALGVEVSGKPLFDAFQVTYNIFDQSLAQIVQELSNQDKRVIIKEALANGRTFPNTAYPHYSKAYQQLQSLANKYQTGIDAIALRFCIDSIHPFKVLSGAAHQSHLLANMEATQFELTKNEIGLLKELAVDPGQYWQERKQLGWN